MHQDIRKYSQKGLRGYSHDVVDRLFDEQDRRIDEARMYFRVVCSFDKCLELWHLVLISGGFRSFSEIRAVARSIGVKSDASVSKYLRVLRENNMAVLRSDGLYQMLGPSLLKES